MTNFTYLLAFLFMFGVPAIIIVAKLRNVSEDAVHEKRRMEQRYQYLRGRFSPDGTLIDTVLHQCLGETREKEQDLFKQYLSPSDLCELCLEAAYGHATIEGLLISSESVRAWSLSQFYSAESSLNELSPDEALLSSVTVRTEGEKDEVERRRDRILWFQVHLSENSRERVVTITRLVAAFSRGELTFRFKRSPTYGRQRPALGAHGQQEENS